MDFKPGTIELGFNLKRVPRKIDRRDTCARETNPGTVFSRQEGELRQCVLGMAGVGCSRDVDNANITGRGATADGNPEEGGQLQTQLLVHTSEVKSAKQHQCVPLVRNGCCFQIFQESL